MMISAKCVSELALHDYIVLVPGAGAKCRQWSVDSFVELADRIGGEFVVVGSKGERELGSRIADMAKARVVNLCGKTTIAQLGGILLNAKFVVTNETGTATYAAVLGVPTICILGGGDFGAFFPNPYCENTVSVFHGDGCYYCGWKCKKANLDILETAPCINSISVDDVMDAINRLSRNKFGNGRSDAEAIQ